MTRSARRCSTLLRRLAACLGLLGALASAAASAAPQAELPTAVQVALKRAQLPPDALVVYVAELGERAATPPRLAYRDAQPVNPASLMKLYTTGAALELLGPAWTWKTPVLATAAPEGGVLAGDLVLQGRGDPTLVVERLWLLLRQLQQRGIREVRGDIVLDNTAFVASRDAPADPAGFDGERYRPYNVQPDALLLNLKAITLSFVPEPDRGVARVGSDAPLAGVRIDTTVPLTSGDCGDWRGALKAAFDDPAQIRLTGSYPVACGEQRWPIAYADPHSYNARLIEGLWRELGGRLGGRVRTGATPAGAQLLFEAASPPLAAVVRDINKYSNNVMAQQLFLSLGLQGMDSSAALLAPSPGSAAACCRRRAAAAVPMPSPSPLPPTPTAELARGALTAQVQAQAGCADGEFVIDNGSGLSRQARSSARCLGAWLQALWVSPVMPELVSSLPITGVDGTARRPGRAWGAALGRAHLKTGSLRDTAGLAGYVLGRSGRRYAFVAIVSHPNAGAAKPVLDALVDWTAEDGAR